MSIHSPDAVLADPTLAMANQPSFLAAQRQAQAAWQLEPLELRLRCIGRIAGVIAQHCEPLAESIHRPAATLGEIMASEVLPLAEACRYIARRGAKVLAPIKLSQRDNPWWMGGVRVTESRDPWGVVLIIGPSNYPLLLPGVQTIQALAAGNAVLIKPAPLCDRAMHELKQLCQQAGVPSNLLTVLATDPIAASQAIESGVDKVIFTGSRTTGQLVAEQCAVQVTPAAMELSGNDAVFVLPSADLQRVAQSLAYCLSLNGGQTCIAPRRLFATASTIEALSPLLAERLSHTPQRAITHKGWHTARQAVDSAVASGARIACGSLEHFDHSDQVRPLVLGHVQPDMAVVNQDLFAPLLSMIEVADMQQAVDWSTRCPYALGASIFGEPREAAALAQQLSVGCITINDCLVPTADPRVSFGGRRASGYGMTRGLEGLRELTQLKVVCERKGRWLPHLSTTPNQLGPMMRGIIQLRHGSTLGQRWAGIKCLVSAARSKTDSSDHKVN